MHPVQLPPKFSFPPSCIFCMQHCIIPIPALCSSNSFYFAPPLFTPPIAPLPAWIHIVSYIHYYPPLHVHGRTIIIVCTLYTSHHRAAGWHRLLKKLHLKEILVWSWRGHLSHSSKRQSNLSCDPKPRSKNV